MTHWTWAYILQQMIMCVIWAFFLRVIWLEWRDNHPQFDVRGWVLWLIFGGTHHE